MIRVKQFLGGLRLDVGVRILLLFDLITTVLTLWHLFQKFLNGYNDVNYCGLFIVIGFKILIILSAQVGLDNKKPTYLLPYLVCNVTALVLTMGSTFFGLGSADRNFMAATAEAISFKFLFIFLGEIFSFILNTMLLIYNFIVMHSYYQILLEFSGLGSYDHSYLYLSELGPVLITENLQSSATND